MTLVSYLYLIEPIGDQFDLFCYLGCLQGTSFTRKRYSFGCIGRRFSWNINFGVYDGRFQKQG